VIGVLATCGKMFLIQGVERDLPHSHPHTLSMLSVSSSSG